MRADELSRRRRASPRARLLTLAAGAILFACTRRAPDVGGVMLELATDGTLAIDVVNLQIRNGVDDSGRLILRRDYRIPRDTTLPNTIAIASNGDPTATAFITVSAYRLENGKRVPLDRRDAIVSQIPSDRVVGLPVVLSRACTPFVKADPATGDAVSTCDPGTTCSPPTAKCEPWGIDASNDLQPYAPGAAPDAGGVVRLPPDDGGTPEAQAETGPPDPTCSGPREEACGSCGTRSRTCVAGGWSAWGACAGEGPCAPSTSEACEDGGTRTCTGACQWGACGTPSTCTGLAVQACGNCGSQTRTCEGGEWSAWGACAGEGVCAANATQACGAGGTQICGGNCQWGTCGGQACAGVATQSCGNCGTQTRTCTEGAWSAWSACAGEGACTPNAVEACVGGGSRACSGSCAWSACSDPSCTGAPAQTCGNCGTQTRTCTAGVWSAFSACTGEGVCAPDATQACGTGGTQTCGGSCQWGTCAGQTCSGNATQSCGNCGSQTRTCNNGTWSAFSACAGEGVCAPATPQACGTGGTQTCEPTCQWGTCTGQTCSGPTTQACGSCGSQSRTCNNGTWSAWSTCAGEAACPALRTRGCAGGGTETCSASCSWGACTPPPSCVGLADTCGGASGSADCCSQALVPGGTYRGTVSDFRLDLYEVTVGRFRKFVGAFSQSMIPAGAGRNPNNAADPGWSAAWNANLPASAAALASAVKCSATYQTWTDAPGANELRPINCLDWYEAEAFCIWDGGRLPTRAEYQYAAAGGSEARSYPWGNNTPPFDASLAIFNCYYNGTGPGTCTGLTNLGLVGSVPAGNARWGHADLGGNIFEWVQDYAGPEPSPCVDCANLTVAPTRMLMGGSFNGHPGFMLTTGNSYDAIPENRNLQFGVRCARSP